MLLSGKMNDKSALMKQGYIAIFPFALSTN